VAPGRTPAKSVRFPKGSDLLAWYEQHAEQTGQSMNGALVTALEEYRERHRQRGGADEQEDIPA
jgi:hypothetical protein